MDELTVEELKEWSPNSHLLLWVNALPTASNGNDLSSPGILRVVHNVKLYFTLFFNSVIQLS